MSLRSGALVLCGLLATAGSARAQELGAASVEPRVHGPDVEVFGARNVDSLGIDALGFGGGVAPALELPLFAEAGLGVHAGAMIFALSPGDEEGAMWVGTRLGIRWHWALLLGRRDADGFLDVHHDFGRSGGITRHAFDVGAGYAFALSNRVALGPYARFFWASDPLGYHPMIVILGATLEIDPNVVPPPEPQEDPEYAWRWTAEMGNEPRTDDRPPRLPFGAERIVPDAELYAARNVDDVGAAALGWGGGGAIHAELMLTRPVGLHVGFFGMALAPRQDEETVWVFGTRFGLRAHWLAAVGLTFADLWSDFHHVFARSGSISRHGFDAGTGIDFSLGSRFAIGPFARLSWVSDPRGDDPLLLAVGLSAGFFERVAPPDADRDGVADERDECPTRRPGRYEDPDRRGCPARDLDHDNILDPVDHCPMEPEGIDPNRRFPGCPASDVDGDGVPFGEDQCPDEPAGDGGQPLAEGCPSDPF